MLNELKKLALAGLGAAAKVVEKTGEAVDSLAKHGEKTLEDTREMRENIAKTISEKFSSAEPDVQEFLEKLEHMSNEGLKAIRRKLDDLDLMDDADDVDFHDVTDLDASDNKEGDTPTDDDSQING